jgi:hypothetical protein
MRNKDPPAPIRRALVTNLSGEEAKKELLLGQSKRQAVDRRGKELAAISHRNGTH